MAGTVLAGQELSSDLLGVPDWTAMSSYQNSWTNTGSGTVTGQYRLWKLLNSVEVIGGLTAGTITNNTTIFTMPSGFIPASIQWIPILLVEGESAAAVDVSRIQVDTSGNLKVQRLGSGTTAIGFHGWYSLDA